MKYGEGGVGVPTYHNSVVMFLFHQCFVLLEIFLYGGVENVLSVVLWLKPCG